MTPEVLTQVEGWLTTLREGGALLVLALLVFMLVRGDLLSKRAVDNMIPQIVAQTVTQIKADIAVEVETQVDKLGDKIVDRVSQQVERRKGSGW